MQPEGAIQYIAAIMRAGANIAQDYGYYIYCDPPLLANIYAAWDLHRWRDRMKEIAQENSGKKQKYKLKIGSPMAFWVRDHLTYLEEGVGESKCFDPRANDPTNKTP